MRSYRANSSRIVLCLIAALCASPVAHASESVAPEAVSADPAATFSDAVKLFMAGEFAAALPMFEAVANVTQSPNAELYVGYCRKELGELPGAYRAFSAAVRLSATGESRYAATGDAARAELLRLNALVARLTLSFVDAPADLVVHVGDTPIERDRIGSPIILEPGSYRVTATASGVSRLEQAVQIEAGEGKILTLAFPRPAAPPPSLPERAPERPTSGTPLKVAGWATAAFGTAGLALFVVTGLQAKSIYDRLQTECPRGCSDPGHIEDVSRGRTLQTVANASLGVGVVAVTTGAVLLFLGYDEESDGRVGVTAHPRAVNLSYGGSF